MFPTLRGVPPLTPILDRFDRADENPLSGGGNWARLDTNTNNMQLLSKTVAPNITGALQSGSYWTPETFTDVEVHALISTVPNAPEMGILARIQQPGGAGTWDGYAFMVGTTAAQPIFRLYRVTNGSASQLGGFAFTGLLGGQDSMVMRCFGQRIECWRMRGQTTSQLMIAATDRTFASGNIGLWNTDTSQGTTRFDLFGGGAISGQYANNAPGMEGAGLVSI